MDTLTKHIHIAKVNYQDKVGLEDKATKFFLDCGCRLIRKDKNTFVFGNSSSTVFDAWKFNPLKRNFEVAVTFNETEISAFFTINNSGQLDPVGEDAFWNSFAQIFRSGITSDTDFESAIQTAVRLVRKKNFFFMGYILVLIFLAGCAAMFLNQFTAWKSLSYLLIPAAVLFFIKIRETISRRKGFLQNANIQ